MKRFFSVFAGIATGVIVLKLSKLLIDFLNSTITSPIVIQVNVAKVILWILAIAWTTIISILVGKLVYNLQEQRDSR